MIAARLRSRIFYGFTIARIAKHLTGILSAGIRLWKTIKPGIAMFAADAETGGNGIASDATAVPMAYRYLATAAVRGSIHSLIDWEQK